MKEELINKILLMLAAQGIDVPNLEARLYSLMNDYEVSLKETAIAIRSEDRNSYLLKTFLAAKLVAGCANSTLRTYETGLKEFMRFINKNADEVTSDDIRYFLAQKQIINGVTKVYANTLLRYLKTFYHFLHTEEIIIRDPTAKIPKIKEDKRRKPAFSDMDIEKLRGGCKTNRERMCLETLLSTGCRANEFVNIKIADIKGDEILIFGKGGKERIVYLNAKSEFAIHKYLEERKDSNPYLLPGLCCATSNSVSSQNRKYYSRADLYKYPEFVMPDSHYNKESLNTLMKKVGKRAGVEGVHTHRFRRTCATSALLRGMPIEQVSKMLGHESIETTQIYLDLKESDLKSAHSKFVV
jgi:site-specific recombinase XerD